MPIRLSHEYEIHSNGFYLEEREYIYCAPVNMIMQTRSPDYACHSYTAVDSVRKQTAHDLNTCSVI